MGPTAFPFLGLPWPCGLALELLELLELLLRGAMANRVVFFTPGDSV